MFVFFFNDTATTEIYTLSLHDALPISRHRLAVADDLADDDVRVVGDGHRVEALKRLGAEAVVVVDEVHERSEEHTSELQSRQYLVCRLLLEKKNERPPDEPTWTITRHP